jgi:hypothetical protein
MVKASQGRFEFIEIVGRESISAGDITEVQESGEGLHHLRWHMPGDRGEVNLINVMLESNVTMRI